MYSMTPGRRASPHHHGSSQPPDGPIADLVKLIEGTKLDAWQRRTQAFEDLVALIPTGSKYLECSAWFNNPKTLWHLASPVSELLKDPRSTVVRRVCHALTILFTRCQQDARLLFKDLMPTILAVHAQTVLIIRQAVQAMVTESIPEVPCKSAMPLWMDRLKDKSPAVRDACSLYLGLALQAWTEEGYLTDEIWMQVGNAMLKTMRDPSPTVRSHGKVVLERMRLQHPNRWENLISDPSGPTAGDPKLQAWLRSLGNDNVEELSVASKYTYNSESRFLANKPGLVTMRISSPRRTLLVDDESEGHPNREVAAAVPFSIAVKHREPPPSYQQPTSSSGRLGPPVRSQQQSSNRPFSNVVASPANNHHRGVGTPPRAPVPRTQSPQAQTYTFLAQQEQRQTACAVSEKQPQELEYSESQTEEGEQEQDGASPFLASMHELRSYASKRRSRKSLMMQQRFRLSSREMRSGSADDNNDGKCENDSPNNSQVAAAAQAALRKAPSGGGSAHSATSTSSSSPPEHMVIAIRLLRAHKAHVDHIMETLKMEMDTLRDFDRLLEEPGRPTEEEMLTYFESVELCLNQRQSVANRLRAEMDRISQGGGGGTDGVGE